MANGWKTWASVAGAILLVILTAGLSVAVSDRAILSDHETRITVLERTPYATKSDLYELEDRLKDQRDLIVDELKDCLNKIQRGRECE